MAKIFFVGLDGTEKSYRLQTHRPFTLGRDPGNDIILRDPKVSRHHAEIVFERGFFVLHDLASANGTYVNGKRIRVAPLTHGARLRMGNTYGRFSEELPTESEASPIAAAEPFDQPVPLTEDLSNLEILPTSAHERIGAETLPHEKLANADLKKKSGVIPKPESEPPTEPFDSKPDAKAVEDRRSRPSGQAGLPVPHVVSGPFSRTCYRFTTGLRSGETAHIRDDSDRVLLSYRSFASVVGIAAALVSGIVFIAGMAAFAFLIAQKAPLHAAIVIALTLIFTFVIALLVPRMNVTLYDDGNPALTISQRSVFPSAAYVVATPNGATLALLRKSFLSRLGRNRWTITQEGRVIAEAMEESFGAALLRKFLGKFSRRFEANIQIEHGGLDAGWIVRRPDDQGRVDVLDLVGDFIDRRVAVALATVVLGREP